MIVSTKGAKLDSPGQRPGFAAQFAPLSPIGAQLVFTIPRHAPLGLKACFRDEPQGDALGFRVSHRWCEDNTIAAMMFYFVVGGGELGSTGNRGGANDGSFASISDLGDSGASRPLKGCGLGTMRNQPSMRVGS